MPLRLRKFIGAILLITLVVTWALVAMALAQAPMIKANGVIEVIYYVVAGLAGRIFTSAARRRSSCSSTNSTSQWSWKRMCATMPAGTLASA